MNTKSYIFAGIIAAITTNAMATGENTVTSKSYVDAQDALKQNLIDAAMMTIDDGRDPFVLPTLVSYDNTDNLTGTKYGIVDSQMEVGGVLNTNKTAFTLPTLGYTLSQLSMRQMKIPASGYYRTHDFDNNRTINNNNNNNGDSNWLSTDIKGVGLVTKTDTDGNVGERKIFEASDVSGYHGTNLTQYEKDVQDISIPTVGAMMSAISSGVTAAAPTGTANTIANYDANGHLGSGIATYDASGTYTAATDAGKIATAAAVETRQKKKVCAGWPDSVAVNDRTDANCWLWTLPD